MSITYSVHGFCESFGRTAKIIVYMLYLGPCLPLATAANASRKKGPNTGRGRNTLFFNGAGDMQRKWAGNCPYMLKAAPFDVGE